jgi:inositol transport system ATP-binding protein
MAENQNIILQVNHLTKSFGGVKALDNISFTLEKGEVHALMGENGAGKSTFMKLLMGLLQPDSGEIIFEGYLVENKTVHQLLAMGISMIHQEILAVPELTVAQNIFLGNEKGNKFWINESANNAKVQQLLDSLEVNFKATTKIKHLSIAEKQMVEMAKAISNNAKIIIMDEPTSAISDKEVAVLFKIIRQLKEKGVAIIYISHKMDEIYQIADTITVLRDGKYIGTHPAKELSHNALITMMVGREIQQLFPDNEPISYENPPFFSIKNFQKKGKFQDINFAISAGEVLGMAGLMGAGRTEIARAIYGLDTTNSGEIWLNGQQLFINSPKDAVQNGIGYVSEDRKAEGFIPELSIQQNLSLGNLKAFAKGWFVNSTAENTATTKLAQDLKIKSAQTQQLKNLSGGNQQKVVIGKVLLANPKVIILDEPTRGVDIGAKFEIYKLINELKAKGIAIILISSEMPELLGMSDRIMVINKGKQAAIFSKKEATQEKLMQYAIH